MRYKPHIKLVEGLWCGYSRRGANYPIAICRHFPTLAQRMRERMVKLNQMQEDRDAGRLERKRKAQVAT